MHKYKQIRPERLCVGMSGRVGEEDREEERELCYYTPDHASPAGVGRAKGTRLVVQKHQS